MNDTVRVLTVAAALSAAAVAALAWRVLHEEPASAARLVGELRLSRWVAILLSALGATTAGLAVGMAGVPVAHIDAALGMLLVGLAGLILQREPSEGLFAAALSFAAYAAWSVAHRPGWLPDAEGMTWYRAGSATYAVLIGAIAYWVRRR